MRDKPVGRAGREERECHVCGQMALVQNGVTDESFLYGAGEDAVELTARIALWECSNCGAQRADSDVEDAQHEAVCRHLRLLAPAEIRALRTRLGVSQSELALLSGYGEASIKRWENGVLLQNRSADRFLRLLIADPVNLLRLRKISQQSEPTGSEEAGFEQAGSEPTDPEQPRMERAAARLEQPRRPRFRTDVQETGRSQHFSLRATGSHRCML
jgi:putative zinc finger/helix-turn-helix YgiT family protein